MRNIWKEFLYFSPREKVSCILLLAILILFIVVYIAMGDLMKVTPEDINQQKILSQEFEEYEESLIDKEIISENSSIDTILNQITENKEQEYNSKSTSKKINTKLSSSQTIDINSASEELLTRVPGIGKSTASKIISYRNLLGGYTNLEQLIEIQGISSNKLSNLLPYLTIKKKHKTIVFYKVNIQSLKNHPYIKPDQLELLEKIKEEQSIRKIDELTKYYQFKQSDIDRLSPYLDFSI